jgi:hypothetical protein
VITIISPFAIDVIVAVGTTGVNVGGSRVGVNICAIGVAVGDGLGPQLFKERERMVPRRNRKAALLIIHLYR